MNNKNTQPLNWIVKSFKELTIDELYDILHLRNQTFVWEQKGIYQDADYKDQHAIHIMGYIDDKLALYARAFKPRDYFKKASIGRVITVKDFRGFGYGHNLVQKAIQIVKERWQEDAIQISAQAHLQSFYASHGFVRVGEVYMEDGIEHLEMHKK